MKVAIYSRKSVFTGKGESIENQIELCKEYCNRNYDEKIEFVVYEDEGFSGGNINRPQFKAMIKDIKAKEYDALICYRLDRISRNVADFSATLELLQANNCDFISIKEQFDTSTPMGRAMVYISSVFAQLERETIAERVRDNMVQLAKTGRWLGGITPLGFDSERIIYYDENFKERSMSKLTVNDSEMELVKEIYELYYELKSATQVSKRLADKRIKGKRGGFLNSSRILDIISNPAYVKSDKKTHEYLKSIGINVFGESNGNGYLSYNKARNGIETDIETWIAAVSRHEGIIDSDKWIAVQKNRHKMKGSQIKAVASKSETLLNGILKCSVCGSKMYAKKGKLSPVTGKHNYYYICSKKDSQFGVTCDNKNINSQKIDKLVLNELETYDKEYLKTHLLSTAKNFKRNLTENNFIELINEKESQIGNLVKNLSLAPNPEVSGYIMNEITKLQSEVQNLKEKQKNCDKDSYDISVDIDQIEILNDLLTNMLNTIDKVDYTEKRKLLHSVVEEVIWNGKGYTVEINLIGSKKKLI
ncbi:recombinase family protein [Clostridium senegalense]|uniref:recombinase family protein n=1 Tax=Clostridium senegalense TaxID=1465809 RepID=UPI000289B65B|nr:recombinase family protein [Clostridium senegalense]